LYGKYFLGMSLPLVIGIGNTLRGDDGVGPYVISLLEKKTDIFAELAVLDTPGYALLTYIQNRDLVIMVDAASFDASRGDFVRVTREEIRKKKTPGFSLHDADPFSVVDYADTFGLGPKAFVVYAIRYQNIAPSNTLSDTVKNAAVKVADSIFQELAGYA
jgi:hydrogenase maturation protease